MEHREEHHWSLLKIEHLTFHVVHLQTVRRPLLSSKDRCGQKSHRVPSITGIGSSRQTVRTSEAKLVFGSLVKIGIPVSKLTRSLSLFHLADIFLNWFFNLFKVKAARVRFSSGFPAVVFGSLFCLVRLFDPISVMVETRRGHVHSYPCLSNKVTRRCLICELLGLLSSSGPLFTLPCCYICSLLILLRLEFCWFRHKQSSLLRIGKYSFDFFF